MDKYIKLEDIINLIDSKIIRMKEFLINNDNLSPYFKDNILNAKCILQDLKWEILKDNISEEFVKWQKENNNR